MIIYSQDAVTQSLKTLHEEMPDSIEPIFESIFNQDHYAGIWRSSHGKRVIYLIERNKLAKSGWLEDSPPLQRAGDTTIIIRETLNDALAVMTNLAVDLVQA